MKEGKGKIAKFQPSRSLAYFCFWKNSWWGTQPQILEWSRRKVQRKTSLQQSVKISFDWLLNICLTESLGHLALCGSGGLMWESRLLTVTCSWEAASSGCTWDNPNPDEPSLGLPWAYFQLDQAPTSMSTSAFFLSFAWKQKNKYCWVRAWLWGWSLL